MTNLELTTNLEWTMADAARARHAGWYLYWGTNEDSSIRYTIRRIHNSAFFKNDQEAVDFVTRQTDPLCFKAIALVVAGQLLREGRHQNDD